MTKLDMDELERLHREGLRHPEGVEYDVACREAFVALPELLRLARRARLAQRVLGAAESAADAVSEQADNLRVSNDDARYLAAMRRLNDALDALRAALSEEVTE